jgi:Fe(3+) dicitrate transport protein
MSDVMIKAATAIGNDQFVGVKFTHYESEANISYRGIFTDAFEAYKNGTKLGNPAPDDWFLSGRTGLDINHEWEINPDMHLKTLVYWNESYRDYWRYAVSGTTTDANGHTIWNYTDNLNGNNRTFKRIGLDSRLTMNHSAFGIGNEAELGLRLMQEEMLDQTVTATRATPRTGPLSRDRIDSADSLSLFAQNRFDINEQLSVTAGLRAESYKQKRDNLQNTNPADTFSNTEYMPGIGATYWLTSSAQLYGSIYRAFAPPLVGSVIGSGDTPTEAERSVNIEMGVRGNNGPLAYELTAIQMNFSNQVDPGISGISSPNEGSALIQGLETGLGYGFGNGFRVDGNVTWIPTAKYGEDRSNPPALKGNRLPYSPELMANLSLGYKSGPLQAALLANYTGRVYGNGMNAEGVDADGLISYTNNNVWGGTIPSYYTLDLTGKYDVSSQFSLFGAVKNLTDERYISGLRQGIYVGPSRSFEIGGKYKF